MQIRIRIANPNPYPYPPIESRSNPDPDPQHCFKDNNLLRSRKRLEIQFFLILCLMIKGSRSRAVSRSGSLQIITDLGSGRPKNVWILRIRNRNTDDNGTYKTTIKLSVYRTDISCIVSVFSVNVFLKSNSGCRCWATHTST